MGGEFATGYQVTIIKQYGQNIFLSITEKHPTGYMTTEVGYHADDKNNERQNNEPDSY